ncbi:MAG: DUF488 domain-containing protein [Candidatus Micrarchaeota archaeon]|nr:DUF488 domain-containing protein [Candidatus Micrarchaeota archaeon]
MLRLRRVYEPPSPSDGCRVLVDRLWPRGISKEKARLDFWLKDIAPSNELRKWFSHDPAKWPEFVRRYRAELAANPQPLAQLRALKKEHPKITLLFAAKDEAHSNAAVLMQMLA